MFDDKESPSKSFDVDVENMKVIEIKKRLKALGLPVTGVKSELVDRLQVAMLSVKETDVDSTNSDTVVLPDSAEDSSPNKSNDHFLEENLMLSPSKEKDLVQETQDHTVSSAPVPVPLKKRALVQAADETVKPKKKIVLNRNNFPTPKLVAAADDESLVTESNIKTDIVFEKKEETTAVEVSEDKTETNATSGSIKKVVYLATEQKKVLTEAERIIIRAKRFNLAPEDIKLKSTLEPVKKNNAMEWKSKLAAVPAPSLDVLKKRAERFGENVSSVLKQLEEQEKVVKRMSKFGRSIGEKISGPGEQDKKSKRADRFRN